MNHARSQVLARIEQAPDWFTAGAALVAMGTVNAQWLWDLIRDGKSAEDEDLLDAHKAAHPELWPGEERVVGSRIKY